MSDQERRQIERRVGETDRLQLMAREAGREAARTILLSMGVDTDDGESLREFQADFAYLRRSRQASERFYGGVKISLLGAFLVALTSGAGWLITFLVTPKH